MTLKETITEDMKTAMRAKDAPRLLTIRGLLAALKQREVDERIELDDVVRLAGECGGRGDQRLLGATGQRHADGGSAVAEHDRPQGHGAGGRDHVSAFRRRRSRRSPTTMPRRCGGMPSIVAISPWKARYQPSCRPRRIWACQPRRFGVLVPPNSW